MAHGSPHRSKRSPTTHFFRTLRTNPTVYLSQVLRPKQWIIFWPANRHHLLFTPRVPTCVCTRSIHCCRSGYRNVRGKHTLKLPAPKAAFYENPLGAIINGDSNSHGMDPKGANFPFYWKFMIFPLAWCTKGQQSRNTVGQYVAGFFTVNALLAPPVCCVWADNSPMVMR